MADEPIRGALRDPSTGGRVAGLSVEAWDSAHALKQPLGQATSDAGGEFQILLSPGMQEQLIARKENVYFRVLRNGTVAVDTAGTIQWQPAAPGPVVIDVPAGPIVVPVPYDVHGRVVTDRGTAAAGLQVQVWDHQLTGADLIAAGTTSGDGTYEVPYDPGRLSGKQLGDLDVRVLQGAAVTNGPNGSKELARSKVTYQAPTSLGVDLVVNFGDVARLDEHARMVAAMQPLLGATAAADVTADGVIYLANRGGYDPRPLAMAVQAERASTQTGIVAAVYYALFRSGAATDITTAHQLTDTRFVSGIQSAIKSGIVNGDLSIDQALELHRREASTALRAYVPAGGMSSLDALLGIDLDDTGKAQFIDALLATTEDPQTLWDGLTRAGMAPELIAKLQTAGKLGALTRYNAPLISRLVGQHGVATTGDLTRQGLYEAQAWLPIIGTDVPAGLTADAYAAGLALQVRLAEPTRVTADLVRRRQVALGDEAVSGTLANFLDAAADAQRIGAQPVRTWAGFDTLAPDVQKSALRLERLYQISPSDGAMTVLAARGLDSAYAVTRYSEDEFVRTHGDAFATIREATLVHRKAQQVHGLALTLAVDYLNAKMRPRTGVLNGPASPNGSSNDSPNPQPGRLVPLTATHTGDVVHADNPPGNGASVEATLEVLFGNLDFCACDECKSVLGAAAYLVDLLEMLDLHDTPHDLDDPQVVLFDRRPDIQHLQLTCENTNVAMAYIDLVNEILEFYVVNGSLTGFTGHDTASDATTAELLVDPPYVEAAAYVPLANAVFPAPLPFHMPLESLRLDFQAWNTTLSAALAVFGNPADVRRERLGLNPAELSILTDHTFKSLPEHFGEPANSTIDQLNAAVANAKVFCRRLGLTYMDLDAILKTRFVNQGSVLVPLLEGLEVGLDVIQSWFTGAITDQQLSNQFPGDLDTSAYEGGPLTWLTANRDSIMGMVVLTPTAGADPTTDDCDFGVLELRLALPDTTANTLTESEYTKLYRFVRLWRRLGGTVANVDELLTVLGPALPVQPSVTELDNAFAIALARIANLRLLTDEIGASVHDLPTWLAVTDGMLAAADRSNKLAHLLRVGTIDFATVAALTGVDPLAPDMDADSPSLTRFVRARNALKAGPLKVADLDWLVRHQDPGGALTVTPAALAGERRLLRDALAGVDTMLGAANAIDLAATQSAMALVYDPTIVGRFFGLVGGSTTYTVAFATAEESLPAPISTGLAIDPFKKRLSHIGIVTPDEITALYNAADSLTLADMVDITTPADLAAYVATFKAAVAALRQAGVDDRNALAADYPELGAVLDAALAVSDPTARAAAVQAGVLPELSARLKMVALRTGLAAILRLDEEVVAALTSGPDVLHAHADPSKGVLDDLAALETPVAFDHNGIVEALLDPSVTDDHILYVQAPVGTNVTLDADGVNVIAAGAVGATGEVATTVPLSLTVGTPVSLRLTLASLPASSQATLAWRTKGIAKTAIPADRLTATGAATTAEDSLVRLHKAALVAGALTLTPHELTFFSAVAPDTKGFGDDLPVDATITPAAAVAFYTKLETLLWFAAFRTSTESSPDTWAELLETSALATADGQARAAATGTWRTADVQDAVAFVNPAPAALQSVGLLRALEPVLSLAVATNQSVADLHTWTKSDPVASDVDALEAAVKAALDPDAWAQTMQSVHDALRNQRRDALVAWILTYAPPTPDTTTADELYEDFLVDVEMDACMQTSRIRLALSTVQLFVTRCLMGLEASVAPSSIRADRWAWMKRYRVWEANRKIFLFPENWLEPELRDGKSSFFTELEADLLKSDITDELAEDAYLAYLKKLDDVARLEIVGMYLQPGAPGDTDGDVLHLFGRTNGRSRVYYYRRFQHGYWTPWEKIGLNIEGDQVIPVMWRSQLYLFWLTSLVKPRRGGQDQATGGFAGQTWQPPAPIDVELTLAWGEYYHGAWSSPKSTNMRRPLVIRGLQVFHPEAVVLSARTFEPPNVTERLEFAVIYYFNQDVKAYTVTFTSKNCEPLVSEDIADPPLRDDVDRFYQHLFWLQSDATLDSTSLEVARSDLTLRVAQPSGASSPTVDETLLTKNLDHPGYRIRTVMQPLANQWEAPFVYDDEHSTFLVRPDEQLSTVTYVDVNQYVPIAVEPIEIDIPPLAEHVSVPNPRDPIWDPPWMQLVNPNLRNVITNTDPFELDGASFDAMALVR